jgi:hypothetical protein
MRKITHSKVEVCVYNRVQGIDDVVCEGGQAEDDDSQNLEYAISGGQNKSPVAVHTS